MKTNHLFRFATKKTQFALLVLLFLVPHQLIAKKVTNGELLELFYYMHKALKENRVEEAKEKKEDIIYFIPSLEHSIRALDFATILSRTQLDAVTALLTEGFYNDNQREKTAACLSTLLTSFNRTVITGKLQNNPLYCTETGKNEILALLKAHVCCPVSFVNVKCLPLNGGGHQIRHIPVTVLSVEFEKQEQELIINIDSNGRIDRAFLHRDETILERYELFYLIEDSSTVALETAKNWAHRKGATETFIKLANYYWKRSMVLGINPVVAYCQSAKETGYGWYGGSVSVDHKNPCGLKKQGRNGDSPDDFMYFDSWEDGIDAHLDHLALYAGMKNYPKPRNTTKDPRHDRYLFNKGCTVTRMGKAWAVDSKYGKDLMRLILELESFTKHRLN
ncbi:glucosaminidase domain-containing protein [Bacteroides sp. 519]|uniref:glucosaminidase domain-containing protein n=1 Tax=Bacteroides sp. 519 TaxID=2302937 RepID=UPI0013D08C0D|nr:glucosaminidase domain-containing protein [Bacteroides sp. 519]NDV57380.1 hypothetical protein [Bacteroides sp. 519]